MSMKNYKAGQIVTIKGKQYRIKKAQLQLGSACHQCKYDDNLCYEEPCPLCLTRLNYTLYLSPIKPE